MEKSLGQEIKNRFAIDETDIRSYSPLTLAYIGDGIFDLIIRTVVVARGNTSVNQLHQKTSGIVKAHSQAMMIKALDEDLTEEEREIYRRGRNAKSHTMAKNATVADYRSATGFEALMGYLYLTNQTDRLLELVKCGLEKTNRKI